MLNKIFSSIFFSGAGGCAAALGAGSGPRGGARGRPGCAARGGARGWLGRAARGASRRVAVRGAGGASGGRARVPAARGRI